MKGLIAIIAAVSLLVIGTMAFAHGPGGWNKHMGPGWGGHMMGPGYGGHMMRAYGGTDLEANKKFLDDTVELRKSLHDKKFEYREAMRKADTGPADLTKLEKEIFDIQTRIRDKAPRTAFSGFGPCWNR